MVTLPKTLLTKLLSQMTKYQIKTRTVKTVQSKTESWFKVQIRVCHHGLWTSCALKRFCEVFPSDQGIVFQSCFPFLSSLSQSFSSSSVAREQHILSSGDLSPHRVGGLLLGKTKVVFFHEGIQAVHALPGRALMLF